MWAMSHSIVMDYDYTAPFTARWDALQLEYELLFDAIGVPFTPGANWRLEMAEETASELGPMWAGEKDSSKQASSTEGSVELAGLGTWARLPHSWHGDDHATSTELPGCLCTDVRSRVYSLPLHTTFQKGMQAYLNGLKRSMNRTFMHYPSAKSRPESTSLSLSQQVQLSRGASTAFDLPGYRPPISALAGASNVPFSASTASLSQRVQLSYGAGTASVHCTLGEMYALATDRSTATSEGPFDNWAIPVSFNAIRLRLSAQVPILPEELDRPELRGQCVSAFGWFSGFRATGGVSSTSQHDRFVIFTTEYHSQVRTLRRGATLDDVVAEVLGIVPRLRNIRILMDRLEGFPPLQVVATARDCPIPGHATPLDLRPVGGRVCTLNLFPGFPANRISEMIMQDCPASRRPTHDFLLQLPNDMPLQALPLLELGPDYLRGSSAVQHANEELPVPDAAAAEDVDDDQVALLQVQSSADASGTISATLRQRQQTRQKMRQEAEAHLHGSGAQLQRVRSSGICNAPALPPPSCDLQSLQIQELPALAPVAQPAPKSATDVPAVQVPPDRPDVSHPPALLWHHFRALDPKSGHTADNGLPPLIPAYLPAAARREQAAIDFSWGGIVGVSNDAFAIFDVLRHVTVCPRSPTATLQDIVAAAVSNAPFVVQAVQVLTRNLPGFPRPQLVLHRREDDPRASPLPWDFRSVGGRVRTALHYPSEAFSASASAVQAVCPELPDLLASLLTQRLVAIDATGLMDDYMPDDLEEVQFITVERSARDWFTEATGVLTTWPTWAPLGPTSTSTTTQVQADGRRFRFVVLHGTAQAQVEVTAPCLQADAILESLLMDVFARNPPLRGDIHITMARAHPLPAHGVQDIVFLVCGDIDNPQATVVVDQSQCGFPRQTTVLAPYNRCEVEVPEPWRSRGFHLFANVAPVHLTQRPAVQGDYFCFSTDLDHPVSMLSSAILSALPILEPLAWPLVAGDTIGEVLGPDHGPIRFRTFDAIVPDIQDAQAGLARIPRHPAQGLTIAVTRAIEPCRAIFATSSAHSSLQTGRPWRTGDVVDVLDLANCAVPYIPNIVSGAPIPRPPREAFGRLRLDLGYAAVNSGRWSPEGLSEQDRAARDALLQHAAANPFEPPTPAADDQSLLQTWARTSQSKTRQPRVSVPTPMGRRFLPPQASSVPHKDTITRPVLLCLDELAGPHHAQPAHGVDMCLRFPVPEDMPRYAFDRFSLHKAVLSLPEKISLHPQAASLLAGLPCVKDDRALDALCCFVDGSYKEQRTTWAVAYIGFQGGQLCWAGFRSGSLPSQYGCTSAFEGELFAQLVAYATIADSRLPAVVCYDAQAAASVAQLQTAKGVSSKLARAAGAVFAYVKAQGRLVQSMHTPSHKGCPGNELADSLARHALACPSNAADVHRSVHVDVESQAFDWVWLRAPGLPNVGYPDLDQHGDTISTMPSPSHLRLETPADFGPPVTEETTTVRKINGLMCTYNTLSSRTCLQRRCLTQFVQQHGIAFLALQETREYTQQVQRFGQILRIRGPFRRANWVAKSGSDSIPPGSLTHEL